MGIQWMRDELEDLAFKTLKPDAHETISKRLSDLGERNGKLVDVVEHDLKTKLDAQGVQARVSGRQKRPFSVWTKMERKSVAFEQLSDVFGFRIIVDRDDECYRALGIVHTAWPMVPGRFKDYISN